MTAAGENSEQIESGHAEGQNEPQPGIETNVKLDFY
jgi:hypothetical protein